MNTAAPNERQPARFVVGIDLGTTQCAMAAVEPAVSNKIVDIPIPQYTAAGVRERRDTLPSFLYALLPDEVAETDQQEDARYRVGIHARDHGALAPGRFIASTKSWLCHGGVNREAAVLPWHAAADVETLSPVQAQSIILAHLRATWDAEHPDAPLAEQDVLITVPASFDEVARELTIQAAQNAGIPAPILLEEPQAAFYAWLSFHETDWQQTIQPGDHVLICDVGGGTTDLTLIHARSNQTGTVQFHRTAVGEHLILGGDNLDLTLAHHIEAQWGGEALDPASWSTLTRLCRHQKEVLLGEQAPNQVEVSLPSRGAKLLASQRQATLTRLEVERLLLDGFLPVVELAESPSRRRSGFREFGLPYAADTAITKYLAEFLRTHLPTDPAGRLVPPHHLLLNGGLFESQAMRQRLQDVLDSWFGESSPQCLPHQRLDLAVARGAAYYGCVRRGQGIRIVSDLARAYYIGLESKDDAERMHALCVAPAGAMAGESFTLDQHPLQARLKTPVEFPLYVSSSRTVDAAGQRVVLDPPEQYTALPPLRTILTAGKRAVSDRIDVHILCQLTELGSLDLRIQETNGTRSWKLTFDLRASTQSDLTFHTGDGESAGVINTEQIGAAERVVETAFSKPASVLQNVALMKQLEAELAQPRAEWPATLLRSLWAFLRERADYRERSSAHEQRWLNLMGYFLRPGCGVALDDWRVSEMWKLWHNGPIHPQHETVRAEWWILWRRLAAGLTAGQQSALAAPILSAARQLFGGKNRVRLLQRDVRLADHETVEWIRLVSWLERLSVPEREAWGRHLIDYQRRRNVPRSHRRAALWGLGRTGARVPMYGEENHLLSADIVGGWLEQLLAESEGEDEWAFTLMSLARRTGDRYLDISDSLRERVAQRLEAVSAPSHWNELVRQGGELYREEQRRSHGESLPAGLLLRA